MVFGANILPGVAQQQPSSSWSLIGFVAAQMRFLPVVVLGNGLAFARVWAELTREAVIATATSNDPTSLPSPLVVQLHRNAIADRRGQELNCYAPMVTV